MKKHILKSLVGALTLVSVLTGTTITSQAALDPSRFYYDESSETQVENTKHIPERVDLTPEQINGILASASNEEALKLLVWTNSWSYDPYGCRIILNDKALEEPSPYMPIGYNIEHDFTEYVTPYYYGIMEDKVDYLGTYTIGGTLEANKVIYYSHFSTGRNTDGMILSSQESSGKITYDEWVSLSGTACSQIYSNGIYYKSFNYAIIVDGQNSPTFNVGTNILAIISPSGDRIYYDIFGLDAAGNVCVPEGYSYYNCLFNMSYLEYKHKLGACRCGTESAVTESLAQAKLNAIKNYGPEAMADTYYPCCSNQIARLKYDAVDPYLRSLDEPAILKKIWGKSYTPVIVK